MVTSWGGNPNLSAVDGRKVKCRGKCGIWLVVQRSTVKVQTIIVKVVDSVEVVDAHDWVVGSHNSRREVEFGN